MCARVSYSVFMSSRKLLFRALSLSLPLPLYLYLSISLSHTHAHTLSLPLSLSLSLMNGMLSYLSVFLALSLSRS